MCFGFCNQKTAYEMRISDWSSYVCSSDLPFRNRRKDLYDVVFADRPLDRASWLLGNSDRSGQLCLLRFKDFRQHAVSLRGLDLHQCESFISGQRNVETGQSRHAAVSVPLPSLLTGPHSEILKAPHSSIEKRRFNWIYTLLQLRRSKRRRGGK